MTAVIRGFFWKGKKYKTLVVPAASQVASLTIKKTPQEILFSTNITLRLPSAVAFWPQTRSILLFCRLTFITKTVLKSVDPYLFFFFSSRMKVTVHAALVWEVGRTFGLQWRRREVDDRDCSWKAGLRGWDHMASVNTGVIKREMRNMLVLHLKNQKSGKATLS